MSFMQLNLFYSIIDSLCFRCCLYCIKKGKVIRNNTVVYALWHKGIKGIVHTKMKILSLISYSPLCHFKPVRTSFIFGNTNLKNIHEIRELSDPAKTTAQLTCSRPRKVVRTSLK